MLDPLEVPTNFLKISRVVVENNPTSIFPTIHFTLNVNNTDRVISVSMEDPKRMEEYLFDSVSRIISGYIARDIASSMQTIFKGIIDAGVKPNG